MGSNLSTCLLVLPVHAWFFLGTLRLINLPKLLLVCACVFSLEIIIKKEHLTNALWKSQAFTGALSFCSFGEHVTTLKAAPFEQFSLLLSSSAVTYNSD